MKRIWQRPSWLREAVRDDNFVNLVFGWVMEQGPTGGRDRATRLSQSELDELLTARNGAIAGLLS